MMKTNEVPETGSVPSRDFAQLTDVDTEDRVFVAVRVTPEDAIALAVAEHKKMLKRLKKNLGLIQHQIDVLSGKLIAP